MAEIKPKMQALVDAVMAHAEAHYEDGGWDVIVECWDDEEIAELLRASRNSRGTNRSAVRTPSAAIKRVAEVVGIYADRQADARNSI